MTDTRKWNITAALSLILQSCARPVNFRLSVVVAITYTDTFTELVVVENPEFLGITLTNLDT